MKYIINIDPSAKRLAYYYGVVVYNAATCTTFRNAKRYRSKIIAKLVAKKLERTCFNVDTAKIEVVEE